VKQNFFLVFSGSLQILKQILENVNGGREGRSECKLADISKFNQAKWMDKS